MSCGDECNMSLPPACTSAHASWCNARRSRASTLARISACSWSVPEWLPGSATLSEGQRRAAPNSSGHVRIASSRAHESPNMTRRIAAAAEGEEAAAMFFFGAPILFHTKERERKQEKVGGLGGPAHPCP